MTTPPDAPLAIDARDVHRHFRSVRAVDGVDLCIERGEIVALLGPNGAGKTTFLDMVLGFTAPSSGSVRVLGMDPQVAVRRGRVGAVLQTGGLLDDLSVRETVAMVAACHDTHIPVSEALERAGIEGLASRKVSKCSGGEQQRLRFALALLTEPDLLLLDEPTTGMDVSARAEFWRTMHAEAQRGRTIVFATHYLQEASDFADRIVLMRAGRIARDGTVEQLTAGRERRLTCSWIGAGAETPADIAARHGAEVSEKGAGDGSRWTFTAAETDALAAELLTRGLAHDLEIAAAGLDEVFLDLAAQGSDAGADDDALAGPDLAHRTTARSASATKGR